MLANAVAQGLQLFSDIGLGPRVIQRERLSATWHWSPWLVLPVVASLVIACHAKLLRQGIETLRAARS